MPRLMLRTDEELFAAAHAIATATPVPKRKRPAKPNPLRAAGFEQFANTLEKQDARDERVSEVTRQLLDTHDFDLSQELLQLVFYLGVRHLVEELFDGDGGVKDLA